ncbi:hypothetical protein DA2_3362 [Desulfovibrio sp. A2]|nr:hypothetical protein DA2_3362 [Desulfovibrio sp. A2]
MRGATVRRFHNRREDMRQRTVPRKPVRSRFPAGPRGGAAPGGCAPPGNRYRMVPTGYPRPSTRATRDEGGFTACSSANG